MKIAVEAHQEQKDKYGAPYILHPLRAMARAGSVPEKIVAILHDAVEDTDWTLDDLRQEGLAVEIIVAIECVTKREREACEELIKCSTTNPLARSVKLADLENNMDVRRLKAITPKYMDRLDKYLRAWRYLTLQAA